MKNIHFAAQMRTEKRSLIYLKNRGAKREFDGAEFYLPTPPLGQDMTQGQFLSGV